MSELVIDPPVQVEAAPQAPPRSLLGRGWDWIKGSASFWFGGFALAVGLAVLASIPVLQFLALGWLLEAEGRVARSGKLGQGFPGIHRVARIGSALIGLLLVFTPYLILADALDDALLIDPDAPAARFLAPVVTGVLVLSAIHGLLAVARGGRLRYFVQPFANLDFAWRTLRQGGWVQGARSQAKEFLLGLRLGHYLELGVKGFVAGFIWLFIPTALIVASGRAPQAGILYLLGVPLMVLALPWTLMGQARLAAENRFGAAFELGEIRRHLQRAPIASFVALLLTLGLALPLYFAKIEPLPRQILWLPALFFVTISLPARLAAGFACYRGSRAGRAHVLIRWPFVLLGCAVSLSYLFFLLLSQLFVTMGGRALFAQHAFLLPVAFY